MCRRYISHFQTIQYIYVLCLSLQPKPITVSNLPPRNMNMNVTGNPTS